VRLLLALPLPLVSVLVQALVPLVSVLVQALVPLVLVLVPLVLVLVLVPLVLVLVLAALPLGVMVQARLWSAGQASAYCFRPPGLGELWPVVRVLHAVLVVSALQVLVFGAARAADSKAARPLFALEILSAYRYEKPKVRWHGRPVRRSPAEREVRGDAP
jgi:hypothetical protein